MEFLLAERLVRWNYDSQTVVFLKMIMAFLSKNRIGSIKFKGILKLAIENGDKELRQKLYGDYLKVKKAKIGLEEKKRASKNRSYQKKRY